MKKIVIARGIHELLGPDSGFLNQPGVSLLVVQSTDETLRLHRAEKASLIITELGMPGIASEELCSRIRGDADLRRVSIILICENAPEKIEQALRSRVNAVLLSPVDPLALLLKARQLLNVARRHPYRVLVSLSSESHSRKETFFCRSRDISESGMLIESDKQLSEGSRFSCSFLLPDSTHVVHAAARVIRTADQASDVEGHQYGLMFTDISDQARQQLAEYIEKKTYPPPAPSF